MYLFLFVFQGQYAHQTTSDEMITNSSFLIGHFTNCDLHMVMTAYQCEHGTYQGNGIERRVKNVYTLTACMKDRPLHIIYEGSTSACM